MLASVTPIYETSIRTRRVGHMVGAPHTCANRRNDMQNHLIDLNNHLFAEMERLSEEDMTDEQREGGGRP